MVQAYRLLAAAMQERGVVFPLHVGVTEAGNGDSGRIKSCVGISSLLSEGIGNTIRVSLTEDPVAEIPVARYLADRYDGKTGSSLVQVRVEGKKVQAVYEAPSRERLLLDASCDFGKRLLDREIDEISFTGTYLGPDGNPVPVEKDGLPDGVSTNRNTSPVRAAGAPCITSRRLSNRSRPARRI